MRACSSVVEPWSYEPIVAGSIPAALNDFFYKIILKRLT